MTQDDLDQREAEAERLGPGPPIKPTGARRLLTMAAMDLGPLRRHRDFRLLFIGQGVSFLGSIITYVAFPFQAYEISHSSLVVGLLGAVELVPLLGSALVGGAIADAIDRRRMMQITELAFASASAALLVNALLPEPRLWVIFVLAAVMAMLDGLQRPSLEALTPRLVERDEMAAAGALSSFRMTIGMVAGPAIAGVLIATVGLAATYGVDVATFIVSLIALRMMRAVPPPAEAEPPSWGRIVEGAATPARAPSSSARTPSTSSRCSSGCPRRSSPRVASDLGGAGALGLLFAAPALGSLIATATSGWTGHVHRHGAAVCIAAIGWGAGIILFGLAPNLPLALAGLVLAGGADMISGVFRSTIWNQTIPDELRGRLAGIEQVSYSTGPLLGNVEAGGVASLTSVPFSIVSGGVMCVAGVAVCIVLLPTFWRYDSREAHP